MPSYNWKILEISKEDELITHAKYHIVATDDDITVESEGNIWFSNKEIKKPYLEVTEEDIINWIIEETTINNQCHIKYNLDNQVQSLKVSKKADLPWIPTFSVGI